ncbi:MAG: hypothetical protein E7488_08500 [Ruminococcaceae bacterium]|nr:hypothetical protein [Oscillospiraceae bacterium]
MKKVIALVLALICVFGLAGCGTTDNEVSSKNETTNTMNVSEVQSEEETQEQEMQNTEVVMEYFETDLIVNNFFVAYNAIAESPIDVTEIEKGNIKTKALVYIDDFSMEVINAADFLSISISVDPENEDTKLLSIFSSCIKAMYPNVADDEISTAWNAIHETGYMVEDYDFNGIKITYVPSKELSWGTSALRIDLSFSLIYGE